MLGGAQPRGDCFEAALMFLIGRRFDGDEDRWTLCHGVVESTLGYTAGIRHVHAWLEHETGGLTWARNVANGDDTDWPAPVYYRAGRISRVVKYTAEEAARAAVEHDNYGPLDDDLNRVQDAALEALAARDGQGEHDEL